MENREYYLNQNFYRNKRIQVIQYNDEEFKEYPLDNRYVISNYGRCYSHTSNSFLCPYEYYNGYIMYHMYLKDGVLFHGLAHRLVAITFLPTNDYNLDINHIDGNKRNNKVTNLEWCTRSQNIRHAFSTNLNTGKCRRYSLEEKNIICSLLEKGLNYPDIYRILSIEHPEIVNGRKSSSFYAFLSSIKAKRYWTSVSDNYNI